MVAVGWLIVGGSALLIGGAVIWRHVQPAAASTVPPADECETLAKVGGDQAVQICKEAKLGLGAGKAILELFGATFESANDKNTELNGPAVEVLHPTAVAALKTTWTLPGGATAVAYPLRAPFVTRYQNGFVPIPGHPDWSKGKPGSKSMVDDGDPHATWWGQWQNTKLAKGGVAAMLSGDPTRDVLTFQLSDGTWIFKGQPQTCPQGTTIRGTDHRPGVSPCVATYGTGVGQAPPPTPPPPIGATRTNAGTSGRADYRTDPPR